MRLHKLAEPPLLMRHRGVDYKLPRDLRINSSFFIPTLKGRDTFEVVVDHYKPFEYRLTWSERIENGLFGIRVWRVL